MYGWENMVIVYITYIFLYITAFSSYCEATIGRIWGRENAIDSRTLRGNQCTGMDFVFLFCKYSHFWEKFMLHQLHTQSTNRVEYTYFS